MATPEGERCGEGVVTGDAVTPVSLSILTGGDSLEPV